MCHEGWIALNIIYFFIGQSRFLSRISRLWRILRDSPYTTETENLVTFYSISFDDIALVASAYSYKELGNDAEPDRRVKLFWAVFLTLLPIALIFSQNSMANLQTVSIIAAFPVGIIIVLILASFFKDASAYLKENKKVPSAPQLP